MASVGGDVAGDDRDDFGVGSLGLHTTTGLVGSESRSSRMTSYTEAIFFGLFRESVASGILTLWPPPKPPRPGFNEAKVLRSSLNPQAEENAQNAQSLMRCRANMSRIQKERCNHVGVCEPGVSTDRPYHQSGRFCAQPHKSLRIRTYEKRARNPFGIHSYKIIGLKVL